MKNLVFFIIHFALPPFVSSAQPSIQWQKTYGGTSIDEARSIQQTRDGGYIVAGLTASNDGDIFGHRGGFDIWILKLNNTGIIQWKKLLGGSDNEEPYLIQQTEDDGYIVVGYTKSDNYDIIGNHGGYSDGWVIKLNSSGIIQWQRTLGGSGLDSVWSVEQTNDHGYIVAGRSNSIDGDVTENHGQLDFWVVKLSETGTIEWQKSLGGSGDDMSYAVKQTVDSGYIVIGETASADGDVTDLHGNVDFWLVKLSTTGFLEWQKALGGNDGDIASDVIQTSDGGYAVTGYIGSATGDITVHHGIIDYWIAKVSPVGDLEWQKTVGGSGPDWARKIITTADGGYIIAGTTQSNDYDVVDNDGGKDFWVVKISDTGDLVWQKTYGGTNDEAGFSINKTNDDGFILTGYAWSNDGDVAGSQNQGKDDFWVVKLSPSYVNVNAPPDAQTACLKIYPNPASQSVSLQLPVDEPDIAVSIYDLAGREICRETIQNGGGLEVVSLARGLYLVSAATPDGKVFWGKLEKI